MAKDVVLQGTEKFEMDLEDLQIGPADLTDVTGLELKPGGFCVRGRMDSCRRSRFQRGRS